MLITKGGGIMEIIKTTKRKTVTETVTHKTDKEFNIVETTVNGQLKDVKITCKNKKLSPVIMDLPADWVEQYQDYYTLSKYITKIYEAAPIDENKVYFMLISNWMLFDCNMKIVSIPFMMYDSSGLYENEPDDPVYRKLVEALKAHPYFLMLEEKEVEWYSRDFEGQKGIGKAKILLPQDVYESLYEKYRNEEFWSVCMGDVIAGRISSSIYGDEIRNLFEDYYIGKCV
jgi:hypothetical protein